MHLPIVDNFWHAQATFMLTERLPLYILAVYASFLYVPLACVWRLGLPPLAEVTLAGVMAVAFYSPFDVVGAKFLWWTWHDSDTVVMERLVGVPVSSTMWVGVYSCMFALLFRMLLPADNQVAPRAGAACRATAAGLLAIPAMMFHMMFVQCVIGGSLPPPPPPDHRMLGFTLVVYGSLMLSSLADTRVPGDAEQAALAMQRERTASAASGGGAGFGTLAGALVLHYGVLLLVAVLADPTTHVSVGVHQTFGPCGVEVEDYAANVRHKYVCRERRFADYSFHCEGHYAHDLETGGQEGSAWRALEDETVRERYVICGLPKTETWVRKSVGYTMAGALAFFAVARAGGRVVGQAKRRDD